ncbi:Hypothetical_protein [Hexamita inflata]|uniref:Hypothetical_protein n=1 Tax=Hexamita inflata TaxID=28002 RepID=A0AA86NT19_9EUKA|nr:Hypothetical protein HINF_LOCUS11951 [Hexamita inflata]
MYHEWLSPAISVKFYLRRVQIQKIIYPFFAFVYSNLNTIIYNYLYIKLVFSTPNVQQTAGSSRICGQIVHQADKDQSTALKYKVAFIQHLIQEQALAGSPSSLFSIVSTLNQLQFKASLQTSSTLINRENFLNPKTGNATPQK